MSSSWATTLKKQVANEWISSTTYFLTFEKMFSTNLVEIQSSYPQLQPYINRENISKKIR